MSNSMKLLARTVIILLLMIIGSWLSSQEALSGSIANIAIYTVYLLIGIMMGSTANPRFTKAKNKWIYFLPILIFGVVGSLTMLYSLLHVAAWPFGIGNYLTGFTELAWAIVGFFLSLAFR